VAAAFGAYALIGRIWFVNSGSAAKQEIAGMLFAAGVTIGYGVASTNHLPRRLFGLTIEHTAQPDEGGLS
jgi:hypothetical protein